MPDRLTVVPAVYAILRRDREVLLMRRAGSGYRDGQLSLPSGHLEPDEDVVSALTRELGEELAIEVAPSDCRLAVVVHRRRESDADRDYLDLVFTVDHWGGTPQINEPTKCSELRWALLDPLPHDIADYVGDLLRAWQDGHRVMLSGWST